MALIKFYKILYFLLLSCLGTYLNDLTGKRMKELYLNKSLLADVIFNVEGKYRCVFSLPNTPVFTDIVSVDIYVCRLRLADAAKKSIGTVIVGVFPCTQLAGAACGSFRSGIEFCHKLPHAT